MLYVYTDGGARGNPGPAGAGVVFLDKNKKIIFKGKKYLGKTTNNKAEYFSLILAIKSVLQKFKKEKDIICFLDSNLVVSQLNGKFKIKEKSLLPFAEEVFKLTNKFDSVIFKHIPREKNREADKLVNLAIDENLNLKK